MAPKTGESKFESRLFCITGLAYHCRPARSCTVVPCSLSAGFTEAIANFALVVQCFGLTLHNVGLHANYYHPPLWATLKMVPFTGPLSCRNEKVRNNNTTSRASTGRFE